MTISENLLLYIFGKIPQPQPGYRDEFAQNHVGSILLLDATIQDPDMFEIVRQNRLYAAERGPYRIAVQADTDIPDAVCSRLLVQDGEVLHIWNATEPDGVKAIFLELLRSTLPDEDIEAIIACIENP